MASLVEVGAMRRAVVLSAFGLGSTSPNPPVGCVILDESGSVVGEGYHRRKGEPHAEALALAMAGARAASGTAMVTMEPCNHHGRTPPCHQALLDAGVRRVVIAVIDPTSRGEGGAARMAAAGVSVEVGVLADEALVVLRPWLSGLATGRPWVVWVYEAVSNGHCPVAPAPGLRDGLDAVVHRDGSVVEATPGSHGPGVFALPASPIRLDSDALADLYAGGVRSLLVDGPTGAPLAAAGLVDELHVVVPEPTADVLVGTELVPRGFSVTRIDRQAGRLLLTATPTRTEG
jgi:diaminohydroxyphosphoribosylaminopyrimidine deaminase/5-amino-6-(5-phosphoribosylamino)uracil reductase